MKAAVSYFQIEALLNRLFLNLKNRDGFTCFLPFNF